MHFEEIQAEFTVSTDPARLDREAIYAFLSQTYWARDRPREVFEASVRHSLCFGVYHGPRQIGFARAITDYATFGYLADVYILEAYRRLGLGRWLVKSILNHPALRHLRRWCLVTPDMQALYRPFGFSAPEHPEYYMERLQPYPRPAPSAAAPGNPPGKGTGAESL